MTRFQRLTDSEARTLTRAELLDRAEAEQAYWLRKRTMTDADVAAEREFRRIWHAYLTPEATIKAAMDTVRRRRSDYWETRPCDEPAPELSNGPDLTDDQQAPLSYGLRRAVEMPEREAGQ